MTCPFLGSFDSDRPAENRPHDDNVCRVPSNPAWPYSAVDVDAQDAYCFSRKHPRCPRYQMAQSKGIKPPHAR